jgi:hypothetical protein
LTGAPPGTGQDPVLTVLQYHQDTKHHTYRYARSLGYLDWANQPDPFRNYDGAHQLVLPRECTAADPPYGALFEGELVAAEPNLASLSDFLRHSLGLSAWKQHGDTRWALRVNPSSGNLHPTEGWILAGPDTALGAGAGVHHYRPREHALERRAEWSAATWQGLFGALPKDSFVVGLSSGSRDGCGSSACQWSRRGCPT